MSKLVSFKGDHVNPVVVLGNKSKPAIYTQFELKASLAGVFVKFLRVVQND